MGKIKKKAAGRQIEPESLPEEMSTKSTSTQRPKTSPYTSAPVRILIGSGHKYYVPRHLLQNPKWIASCSDPFMYEPDIHLPDVDESIGHVLVHYLYTGAYQTFDNMKTSSAKEVTIEFKRAFLVYAMAKIYELAGLQQLAMHEMEHHSMKMNVFDVFEALSEDFSKLQAKDDWFQGYLNEKIKLAFEEDYTIFAKNDLFDRISNDALNKFVVKHVIELYNSKVSRMLNTEQEVIQKFFEEYVPAAQNSPVEEISAEVFVAIEEVFIADCPIHEGPTQECSVQECFVRDPPVEEALVQETFIEETITADAANAVFMERASVTDENLREGDECAVLDKKAEKTKRKGVAVIIDEYVPDASKYVKLDEKDRWFFSFGSAKNNEIEKNNADLIEDTFVNPEPACKPVLESEPEATKEADFWRFESFSTDKKRKGKKDVIEENIDVIEDISVNPELDFEPVKEPEPDATKEDFAWGFSSFSAHKKKKEKKNVSKLVRDKPNMEELAPSPLEPAPLADDGWSTLMMSDKKKKGKRSAKQNTLVTEPSSSHSGLELRTEPEPEPEKTDKVWVDWGTTATRKEKSSKGKKEPKAIVAPPSGELYNGPPKMKAINESNVSTASPYAEQVENGTLWPLKQNEEVETRVSSNGHSGFQAEPEPEQPVKIEDGICPVRAKHLLEGDKWKTCRQCRAVLRQVAIQLASTAHADVNEYELIDYILTE